MLVTFYEAARHCEISESLLRRQIILFPGFPKPVATNSNGKPLYDLDAINFWWSTPQTSEPDSA